MQNNDPDSDDSFYSTSSLTWDDQIYFSDSSDENGFLKNEDVSLLSDNSRDVSSDAYLNQYFADDSFCDTEVSHIFSSSSDENIIFTPEICSSPNFELDKTISTSMSQRTIISPPPSNDSPPNYDYEVRFFNDNDYDFDDDFDDFGNDFNDDLGNEIDHDYEFDCNYDNLYGSDGERVALLNVYADNEIPVTYSQIIDENKFLKMLFSLKTFLETNGVIHKQVLENILNKIPYGTQTI